MSDIKEQVDSLMHRYASWASSHGINLEYPHMTPYRKLLGSGVGVAQLEDRVAEEIDQALSELKHVDVDARKVAVLYYFHGISLRRMSEIEKRLTFDRARMSKAYLDGYLSQKLYNILT